MNPIFYLIFGILVIALLLTLLRIISSKLDGNFDSWTNEEELTIFKIVNESYNVKSFYLKRSNGLKLPTFQPGQFLSFKIGDDKIYRSYSLSSYASNLEYYKVSIKLIEGGVGSSWFFNRNVLDKVKAFAPKGTFSDYNLENKIPRVYIAGGIGITPFIPMVMNACEKNISVVLFYGMRTQKDMVFHEELTNISNKFNCFSYFPVISEDDINWSGTKGYIDLDLIKSKIQLFENTHFYLCGPDAMTSKIISSLQREKLDRNIHIEEFLTKETIHEVKSVTVEFNNRKINYESSDNLLDFLEDSGEEVLFSCRVGVCGVCKCKLLSGEVDSDTESGLSEEELRKGYILTCVSRPLTNIKIESDE